VRGLPHNTPILLLRVSRIKLRQASGSKGLARDKLGRKEMLLCTWGRVRPLQGYSDCRTAWKRRGFSL